MSNPTLKACGIQYRINSPSALAHSWEWGAHWEYNGRLATDIGAVRFGIPLSESWGDITSGNNFNISVGTRIVKSKSGCNNVGATVSDTLTFYETQTGRGNSPGGVWVNEPGDIEIQDVYTHEDGIIVAWTGGNPLEMPLPEVAYTRACSRNSGIGSEIICRDITDSDLLWVRMDRNHIDGSINDWIRPTFANLLPQDQFRIKLKVLVGDDVLYGSYPVDQTLYRF